MLTWGYNMAKLYLDYCF